VSESPRLTAEFAIMCSDQNHEIVLV